MRKLITWIAALAVALSLVVPSLNADAANKTFTDVPADLEVAEDIYRFVEQGVINGYGDGTFGPWDDITRQQTAVMLTRVLDLEIPDSQEVSNYFSDVKADDEEADKIAAIAKADIMTGDGGKFNPHEKLTREQMASVLARGFDLSGGTKADINLSNVDKSHKENVQKLANLGITNQLDNFRPGEYTTRSQFVSFLARAIDNSEDLVELLKKAYENEFELESYEMDGSVNFGITLPESMKTDPEVGFILQMLEDIQVDITGSYQKDPMLMEATVDVTLQIDPQAKTTLSIPIIMSEEKMWIKIPQIPGEELPAEIDGKFIEFDLDELDGQQAIDMDVQMELAQAIQNLFLDHFGEDYYGKAEAGSYDIPEGVDAKQVVKFNLENEDLKPFAETLLTGFLPEFFEFIIEEGYAEALGLTEEEVQEAREELANMSESIDEIIAELDKMININTFEEYVVINKQDIIASNAAILDVDITVEEETIGLTLTSNLLKRNIGQAVTINIPTADETISIEELENIMMEELEGLEDL